MDKMLLWFNFTPVVATLIFCFCVKTLIPEQYKSYIDGFLLAVIAVLFIAPFIINYFLLRSASLLKQRKPLVLLVMLSFMVLINLICLVFMYGDQFETSRGFALIACGAVYFFLFLPLWIVFLFVLKKIDKRE